MNRSASLLVAVAALTVAPRALSTIAIECASVSACGRPGPVAAGDAAVRVTVPSGLAPNERPRLTLLDESGSEISTEPEWLADGTAFLRAEQTLDVGQYLLQSELSCAGDPLEATFEVVEAPDDVPSLGELSIEYEAYCPGATHETRWFGTGVRDYPPPVKLSLAFSEEAAKYQHFLALELEDDLGNQWATGVISASALTDPFEVARASSCGVGPVAQPNGVRRTFSATARIVDGPKLPTLTAEADVTCADCPPEDPDDGGAGQAGTGQAASDARSSSGCSVEQRPATSNGVSVLLLAAAVTALKRRADGRRLRRSAVPCSSAE